MLRNVIDAALLRREGYLRMIVARDGVADGAVIVLIVSAIGAIPAFLDGAGLFAAARGVLRGLVWWIILSGLIYLIGRRGLDGDGSFPGTMAAVSVAMPIILVSLVLAPLGGPLFADLIVSLWLVAALWVAAKMALELDGPRAAIAAVGGWVGFLAISALFRL